LVIHYREFQSAASVSPVMGMVLSFQQAVHSLPFLLVRRATLGASRIQVGPICRKQWAEETGQIVVSDAKSFTTHTWVSKPIGNASVATGMDPTVAGTIANAVR
jgi:hypothetical protein